MPKMKTHSGAARRFKKTGKGKLRRQHAYHNHILTKKRPKRKRRLRQRSSVDGKDAQRIRRMLR